jgi:uncharacterized membrane protein
MALAGVFAAALVAFLVVDAIWLRFVAYPLFERNIGDILRDDVQLWVAGAFYVFYVGGVLYFAVMPALAAERPGLAALNGALLGFLAYGTYEATNMATIKGWAWEMVAVDTAWGAALTAMTALVGYAAGRLLL